MDSNPKSQHELDATYGLWLLLSLLLSLLVLPLTEGFVANRVLLVAGLTITFVAGALQATPYLRLTTLVLLLVGLPATWATFFYHSKTVLVIHCVAGSAFFWLVGGIIVYVIVRAREVSLSLIYGAISAYLLFGLAWALSYWGLFHISAACISIPGRDVLPANADASHSVGFSHFIYYSFVTMTTLGYGDIAPVGRVVRTLSWMQAVVGQFYVAVLIAWLVSALPRPGSDT